MLPSPSLASAGRTRSRSRREIAIDQPRRDKKGRAGRRPRCRVCLCIVAGSARDRHQRPHLTLVVCDFHGGRASGHYDLGMERPSMKFKLRHYPKNQEPRSTSSKGESYGHVRRTRQKQKHNAHRSSGGNRCARHALCSRSATRALRATSRTERYFVTL
jgi:hypothetical protein